MSDLSPDTIPQLEHGWTRERKARFLDYLSEKGNVRAACKRVGLSREAAYRLRRRDGEFARGWAAALVLAHDASVEVLADRAIDGVEERIYYRGELIDTRRKYDTRLLLAHVARLDKLVAENAAAAKDAARFDELLACIGGETVPEVLRSTDDILPLDREESAAEAAAAADDTLRQTTIEQTGKEPAEEACIAAFRAGRAAGQAQWDIWFDNACGYVDWLSGWDDGVPVEPMSAGDDDEWEGDEDLAEDFEPRTVSDVSTGGQLGGLAAAGDQAAGDEEAEPAPAAACAPVPPALPAETGAGKMPQPTPDPAPGSAGPSPVAAAGPAPDAAASPRPGTYQWHLRQRAIREAGNSGGAESA